jgi:glycosyltransferase involved in cell wall biosynthesis
MKLFGFKVIHTFHGVHIEETLIGEIKVFVDRFLVMLTDRFICVSQSELNNASKHGIVNASKAVVIHNGVLANTPIEKTENKIFTIGTLSRLNYQKGLDILVEYISRFASEEPAIDFKVLVAGEGELKEQLHNQNQCSKIEFLGNVDPEPFLNNIDLYISFARWEGLPIAVLEAMANASTCLVSNVDGNSDLIEQNLTGKLFELSSYESFKKELSELIDDGDLRKRLGNQARKHVLSKFTIERMSNQVIKLYREVKL